MASSYCLQIYFSPYILWLLEVERMSLALSRWPLIRRFFEAARRLGIVIAVFVLSAAGLSTLFDCMLFGFGLLLTLPFGAAVMNSVLPSVPDESGTPDT